MQIAIEPCESSTLDQSNFRQRKNHDYNIKHKKTVYNVKQKRIVIPVKNNGQ